MRSVWDEVRDQTVGRVWVQVQDRAKRWVEDWVWDEVGDRVGRRVEGQVRGEVGEEVEDHA